MHYGETVLLLQLLEVLMSDLTALQYCESGSAVRFIEP